MMNKVQITEDIKSFGRDKKLYANRNDVVIVNADKGDVLIVRNPKNNEVFPVEKTKTRAIN